MKNPGWAGETGEFDLTEAEVRGAGYVGIQPPEGWAHGGVTAYPYLRADGDPEAPLFQGPHRQRLDTILSRYPNRRAALLPVLNLAHEIRGHLSQDAMDAVARELGESPAAVRGVATFYTMYNKRPVGRHLIQVCTNVSCNLCGGHEVFEAFLAQTGTEPGQISEDGEFTVIEVECLGACGFPTAVQVNSRYFENVEVGDVPDLLERLKRHGVDPVDGAAGRATSTSTSNSDGSKSKSMGGEEEGEGER
ncbi:MAG TPA: NAD(P)H-dependent oxidoreductase subunit E [Longimicrobiales bacterium]|nr:NAD(P)H-dependent oxidoreductase subunit E [Longimicrobiales bacterium]